MSCVRLLLKIHFFVWNHVLYKPAIHNLFKNTTPAVIELLSDLSWADNSFFIIFIMLPTVENYHGI